MQLHTIEKWEAVSQTLREWSNGQLLALLLGLLFFVFCCDYITGPFIPFTAFYLIPIWISGNLMSARWAYALATLATAATTYIDLQAIEQIQLTGFAWKAAVSGIIFFLAADLSLGWTKLHKHLEEQATTDPLTGVRNRRAFFEMVTNELARSQRKKTSLSLAFIDLDNFKQVNDSCGHEKGDEILIACTSALAMHLRRGDILGRLGGDEFAVLLHETDREQVRPIMSRLVGALTSSTPLLNSGVTFSMGVVTSAPGQSISADELLAMADAAMYEVKHSTKNAVNFTVSGTSPPG